MGAENRAKRREGKPSAAEAPQTGSTHRTGESLRLSDPRAKQDVAALQRQIVSDPKRAGELLRRAGIITSTGKLSRDFGG